MTKSELINTLTHRFCSLKRDDITDSVTLILNSISTSLAAGDRIEIRGFGSFSVHTRKARIGRNPATGESVSVPPKPVIRWKMGAELRQRVVKTWEAMQAREQRKVA